MTFQTVGSASDGQRRSDTAPDLQSFDVFDTVLTRRLGAPAAVADVLSRRLENEGAIPVAAAVFSATRKRLETQLTSILGRHASLREIHRAAAEALSVEEADAEAWAQAEEDLERELIVPIPGARQRVDAARVEGRVVFVSDTPHGEGFIKELLLQHGLAAEQDLVFTSSDRGVSKAHGGLFEAVAHDLEAFTTITHAGDNPRSDVAAARAEGWGARLMPDGQLSRYEHSLESWSLATDGLTSWLAGSSRLARLEAVEKSVTMPVAAVASGVLGPLVVGFALWVAAQARRRGVQRLYYVARDGEVMLRAARHVLTQVAPDIELRYLYGSRKPWIFGAIATSDDFLADWVLARPDYTPRTLLARVDLTPELVHAAVPLSSCQPSRADEVLSQADSAELAQALQREPLLSMVQERAAVVAKTTLAYLAQEGLTDGTPSALVDAGWGGRTAAAFDHLLDQAGAPQVSHFLMGIRGSSDDLARRGDSQLYAWLFDEQTHPTSTRELPSSHTLIEMLCAGTTGRTLGYELRGSRYEPVLAAPHNTPVVDWGLPDVQRTAAKVAELVSPHLTTEATRIDTRAAIMSVLRSFWVHPTKAEAAAWGTFPWEEEIATPYAPLAQRVTTTEVIARLLRGDRHIRRVNSWRAGSALASTQPWQALLRLRGWQLDNRARFRRVPRRLRLEWAARFRR
jgi:FMN phosphatase YigB (HAD superfamily)